MSRKAVTTVADDDAVQRQRGAALHDRFVSMSMTADEVRSLVDYLIGAAPDDVEGALEHVERWRDIEPREQRGYADLPFTEQARRQANWLNARGQDVCPACLGFRKSGRCLNCTLIAERSAGPTGGLIVCGTPGPMSADRWVSTPCCDFHANRPNGLPCDGACCHACPGVAAPKASGVNGV
jgi:hypothetical protein